MSSKNNQATDDATTTTNTTGENGLVYNVQHDNLISLVRFVKYPGQEVAKAIYAALGKDDKAAKWFGPHNGYLCLEGLVEPITTTLDAMDFREVPDDVYSTMLAANGAKKGAPGERKPSQTAQKVDRMEALLLALASKVGVELPSEA